MRSLKICPNKGCLRQAEQFEYHEIMDFCTVCGTKLENGLGAYCHHCNRAIKASWDWCGFCGGPTSLKGMAEQREKKAKQAKRHRRRNQEGTSN